MRLCKFSIFLLCSLFATSALSFDDNECLKQQFEVDIIHKGQPFGLLPVILNIKKQGCLIDVNHEKFKYIKKSWSVDICREPVHIKKGTGAVDVIKKNRDCQGKVGGPFCQEYSELQKVLQDDGLIFAPGEKETLTSDHGKTYCTYLLLKNYLENSLVFNRGQDYKGVLSGQRKAYMEKAPTPQPPPSAPVPVMEEGETPLTSPEVEEQTEVKDASPKGQGFF